MVLEWKGIQKCESEEAIPHRVATDSKSRNQSVYLINYFSQNKFHMKNLPIITYQDRELLRVFIFQ